MMWAVISSFLILTSFIVWIAVREKEIPDTISETYYMITHKGLFTLVIWTCAILLLPSAVDAWNGDVKIIPILSVFGLGMVGVAPKFKDSGERKIHIIGATLSGIGSLLIAGWSWQLLLMLIPIIGIAITAGRLKDGEKLDDRWENYMFWIEITCFLITYITLLRHEIKSII